MNDKAPAGAELAELRAENEALRAENEALRAENEDFRARLKRLERERAQAGRAAVAAGGVASKVFAGPKLTRAFRAWFDAKSLADPFPAKETTDVAAAIVRRWLRVGLWHLALASGGFITAGILIWQGFLIRGQSELLQNQLQEQATDRLLDRIRSKAPGLKRNVLRFLEIERHRGLTPDLTGGVDFSGMDFSGVDFSDTDLDLADFSGANLSEAKFSLAKLTGVSLGADLRGADLRGADLRGADLKTAKLVGTDLRGADFRLARFNFTNLGGVDLSGSRNLTPEQLANACGDETTKLPSGFEMPNDWPCRIESEREFGGRLQRVSLPRPAEE